jgi:hypothetical protein
MTADIDTAALRALAEAAESMRWEPVRTERGGIEIRDENFNRFGSDLPDAAYIAAANPAAVIALLDRLERAEAKIAEAWDEGYDEAEHYERGAWNFVPKNPYRSGEDSTVSVAFFRPRSHRVLDQLLAVEPPQLDPLGDAASRLADGLGITRQAAKRHLFALAYGAGDARIDLDQIVDWMLDAEAHDHTVKEES